MTRSYRNQGIRVCPHCKKSIDGFPEPPFNAWIRAHALLDSSPGGAALSITDLDVAVHQYYVKDKSHGRVLRRQNLMYIEDKSHNASLPDAQRDTLGIIYQHAKAASTIKVVARGKSMRGVVTLTHHGLHVVQFSGTTPDDSETIRWDGKVIDQATLVDILRFKVNALTLKPREDRSHHKADPVFDEDWLTTD